MVFFLGAGNFQPQWILDAKVLSSERDHGFSSLHIFGDLQFALHVLAHSSKEILPCERM